MIIRYIMIGGALFFVGVTTGYFIGRPGPGDLPVTPVVAVATPAPTAASTPMITQAKPTGSATPTADAKLTLSAGEFDDELKKLLADTSGNMRQRFGQIFALLQKLDPSQIPQALADIKQFTTGREQGMLSSALIGRLAETDPVTALSLAKALPNAQDAARAMQMAINQWSQSNPTAAIGYAMSQPASFRSLAVDPDGDEQLGTA
ncbi:MAG: hypothetical protein QM796_08280 [Chthoniobacteraceae bacterium]